MSDENEVPSITSIKEEYEVPVLSPGGTKIGTAVVHPDMTATITLDDPYYQKLIQGSSLVDLSMSGLKDDRVDDIEIALPAKKEEPQDHFLVQTIPSERVDPPTNLWGHG